MRVIVTGGAGFIGSNLVKYLVLNKKLQVLTLDKLTYAGKQENLQAVLLNPLHKFVKMDICNINELMQLVDKFQPNWILHLAAESHVDRSIKDANNFVQANVVGSYNVAEVALRHWQKLPKIEQRQFKLIHISTDEVYGSILDKARKFSETSAYNPSSPYSATKAGADMLMHAYYHTFGLPVIKINCSNNYGPNQHPEKLIPLCILHALAGKNIPVYGDGKQIRDWLYVIDHIRALTLITKFGSIGQTYCIGGNCEIQNIELITMICQILDKIKPLQHDSYKSLITFVPDRLGHDRRYAIDSSKVKNEFAWEPKIDLHEGLSLTINWYINNNVCMANCNVG